MTDDDLLFHFRLLGLCLGGGTRQCEGRLPGHGHPPPTYYRWKGQVDRYGLEMLRPRERRHRRMPNATSEFVEHRIMKKLTVLALLVVVAVLLMAVPARR